MLRLLIPVAIFFSLLAASCTKTDARDETVLYGVWVNSNAPNDTLQFMRKANKNILRFNNSFNTAMPLYAEVEYSYIKGKLAVALPVGDTVMKPIDSFSWQQQNKSFDILGYQLYLFMSSSATHFLYVRID